MRYKKTSGVVLLIVCLVGSISLVGYRRESPRPRESTTQTGSASRPERYAMVVGIKPEKIDYYKKLHADPWPSVLQEITRLHIQNYSIHMVELKPGEYFLFGYFEYTGEDFASDMEAMAGDAETIRWWKETDPCQYPIETAKEGDNWTMIEEVFFHP